MAEERADLHLHSNKSDGLLSPWQLVELAAKSGLKAIGLTDHDSVDGIQEALEASARHGLELIPGVELSSYHRGRDVHVLGYFIRLNDPELSDYLELFKAERLRRAQKIVAKLNALGVSIALEEIMPKALHGNIGRPHIAEVLVERGHVSSVEEAFCRFLGDDGPACVPKYAISPQKAIEIIHRSGGLAALAHAGAYGDEAFLYEAVRMGFDGLEIFHPHNSPGSESRLEYFAKKRGLFVCGGSDCHGGRNGEVRMGVYTVPYRLVEEMKLHFASIKGLNMRKRSAAEGTDSGDSRLDFGAD